MISDLLNETREKMNKTVQVLKSDLAGIRAGRANSKLLDKIMVDYYGVMTPLNQLGNISTPEPRLLTIALWDTKLIPAVEKEILKSDLGITPTNDGHIIRLVFPELTEERRKELVKLINKMGEESKISIRSIRRDTMEQLKKMKKSSEISEDEQKVAEKDVQKITDEAIDKIDDVLKEKEKEIMAV
ncbi:ribosome recycling factor [Xylanivirga thermophila]|jgi:ribosome recycling factor|uniref:ribosome recycling factor n=1 Tax=Xylanivirga thermophila TaxID=2496273 RepID=UPI00101C00F0|nr:ribosome recycling factor [Xylanivirga thermophila]